MRDKADAAGALFLIAKPFTAETFREALDPSSTSPPRRSAENLHGRNHPAQPQGRPRHARGHARARRQRRPGAAPADRQAARHRRLRRRRAARRPRSASPTSRCRPTPVPPSAWSPRAAPRRRWRTARCQRRVEANFYEVLNIVSALFNLPDHPHLKLYGTYAPGETPPSDVQGDDPHPRPPARPRGRGGRLRQGRLLPGARLMRFIRRIAQWCPPRFRPCPEPGAPPWSAVATERRGHERDACRPRRDLGAACASTAGIDRPGDSGPA